jgi:hypothetical protein
VLGCEMVCLQYGLRCDRQQWDVCNTLFPPNLVCACMHVPPTSPRHPVTRGRGRSPTAALYTRLFSLKTRKYAKIHPKHTHQHLPRAPPPCQHVPSTSPRHPVTRAGARPITHGRTLHTSIFAKNTKIC